MQLDWEKLFKRYVFDDVKTPYFVAAEKLTRTQAHHELFVYALFMGVLFAVVGFVSISSDLPHKGAFIVTAYAFTVVWAAVVFGLTVHPWAAAYCAIAPAAALLYFVWYGFHPNLGPWDQVALIVLVLAWLRYSLRVLAIVKAYSGMPTG